MCSHKTYPNKTKPRGACVAQSVERPTLDFCSGPDLTVGHEIEPLVGLCAGCRACFRFSLCPSAPHPLKHLCSVSLKKKKGGDERLNVIKTIRSADSRARNARATVEYK